MRKLVAILSFILIAVFLLKEEIYSSIPESDFKVMIFLAFNKSKYEPVIKEADMTGYSRIDFCANCPQISPHQTGQSVAWTENADMPVGDADLTGFEAAADMSGLTSVILIKYENGWTIPSLKTIRSNEGSLLRDLYFGNPPANKICQRKITVHDKTSCYQSLFGNWYVFKFYAKHSEEEYGT